jgi:hypothetical protein
VLSWFSLSFPILNKFVFVQHLTTY